MVFRMSRKIERMEERRLLREEVIEDILRWYVKGGV